MSKDTKFTVKTTVTKFKKYDTDHFRIKVEGSGYEGEAEGFSIGTVFKDAYEDLMMKVSQAIFIND